MRFSTPSAIVQGALGILALASSLYAHDASATSMVELTRHQMVDAADYVVRGTITETWTEPDARGTIWTRAQLVVSRVYKGEPEMDAVIVDQLGGQFFL